MDFHCVASSPYHAQINCHVENAVKTCKSLLTKPELISVILYRRYLTGAPPQLRDSHVQLLCGRRTRTRLPVARKLLTPQVISNIPEKIKIRKQKQKRYYDRHSHELPRLRDGDALELECDCHGSRNGNWGSSLERKGPVPT